MIEVNYAELQQHYGGRYVARRDGEVIASSPSYDNLIDRLERHGAFPEELVIEYVEPPDAVYVLTTDQPQHRIMLSRAV